MRFRALILIQPVPLDIPCTHKNDPAYILHSQPAFRPRSADVRQTGLPFFTEKKAGIMSNGFLDRYIILLMSPHKICVSTQRSGHFYLLAFIFRLTRYCSASGTSINSTVLSKFFLTTSLISSSVTLKNSRR